MRIVFVLHQFYPEFSGGTEHVALNLARSLQRAGHYVHVLACAMRPLPSKRRWRITREIDIIHEVYHGVPITWIARKHLPAMGDIAFDVAPATVNKLSMWMRAQRFDLMHLFHAMRMSSAVLAAQQCKLPYVATVTDFFFGCYRVNSINMQGNFCTGPQEGLVCERDCLTPPWTGSSLLNRYQQSQALLQAAGERVVPSEYVAQYFRNAFPAMSWRVIPHGIDFLNLLPASRKDDASCVEDKSRDFIVLGYLGSIIQPKGLHILLQALARTPSPRLRLRIVGGFYGDPVYKRDILRMIEADPRVQWEGQVDPTLIASELKQMDLLCLPSLMPETFSLVLHEAAVLQIPALVSDLGAQEHYVTQHQSGRVIARGDIFAWSQALQEIASDPQQISAWRANIRMPYRVEEEAFFYESLYRQFITLS